MKCQDNLMLCGECEHFRFPATSRVSQEDGINNSQNTTYVHHVDVVNTVLAYKWFSIQNSTAERVKSAVECHSSSEQALEVKDLLWDKRESKILGEKKARRTGQA